MVQVRRRGIHSLLTSTVHEIGSVLLLSRLSSYFYLLNRHSITNYFNQISLTYINQLSLCKQCYQVLFECVHFLRLMFPWV